MSVGRDEYEIEETVLTVESGEVVRQEHDSGLAELKKVLNDHGIRASLSVRIRRK